jgi:hypothetical protein
MVIDTKKRFNAFRRYVLDQPGRGKQVKELILMDSFMETLDKSNFFALLPNLEIVYLERSRKPDRRTFHVELPMRNSLRYVSDDEGRFELANSILSSGMCSSLWKLKVRLPFTDRSCSRLITLLRNAPHIKDLRIENVDISINDFETLHANLPVLNTLILGGAILNMVDRLPKNIEPATSMRRVDMALFDPEEAPQLEWLRYVREKYVNLDEFRYCCYADPNFYGCERLSTLGFYPVIQHFGSQLKSLLIAPNQISPTVFTTFAKYGCKLDKLSLIPQSVKDISYLSASNLAQHIQTLHLTTLRPFSYKTLKRFLTLKELRLDYTSKIPQFEMELLKYDLNVVDIFNNLPDTVETVDIRNVQMQCEGTMKASPNIQHLHFVGCIMHHDIDLLITENMPNVSTLKIVGFDPPQMVLDLKTLDLNYLEIRPHDFELKGDFKNLVAVRAMNESVTRVYDGKKYCGPFNDLILPGSNPFMYDSLLGKPYNKKRGRPVCTVLCGSLKKLVINDRPTC